MESTSYDEENKHLDLQTHEEGADRISSSDSDDDVSTKPKAPLSPPSPENPRRPKRRVSYYDSEMYSMADTEDKKWMPQPTTPTSSKTPMVWIVGCSVALLVFGALIAVIICVAPSLKG